MSSLTVTVNYPQAPGLTWQVLISPSCNRTTWTASKQPFVWGRGARALLPGSRSPGALCRRPCWLAEERGRAEGHRETVLSSVLPTSSEQGRQDSACLRGRLGPQTSALSRRRKWFLITEKYLSCPLPGTKHALCLRPSPVCPAQVPTVTAHRAHPAPSDDTCAQ